MYSCNKKACNEISNNSMKIDGGIDIPLNMSIQTSEKNMKTRHILCACHHTNELLTIVMSEIKRETCRMKAVTSLFTFLVLYSLGM